MFLLRKSGANTVVRVVDVVVVEVAIMIDVPRVVGVIAVRRTTTNPKKSRTPYNRFLYV